MHDVCEHDEHMHEGYDEHAIVLVCEHDWVWNMMSVWFPMSLPLWKHGFYSTFIKFTLF